MPPSGDPRRAILARALDGDPGALRRLWERPEDLNPPWISPLIPALVRKAGGTTPPIEVPRACREAWKTARSQRFVLTSVRDRLGALLGGMGIAWMPIKGMDTGDRFYESPEDRPTADIDLMIRPGDFDAARSALKGAGWAPLLAEGRRLDRYYREEAYNWSARSPQSILLELHYRLWGFVGSAWSEDLWTDAIPDDRLGPLGHRPGSAQAFLLCAVHHWLNRPPRSILSLWEMTRILAVAGPDTAGRAVDAAVRHGLQLPAGLAAAQAAALWPSEAMAGVAGTLAERLAPAERLLHRSASRRDADRLSLQAVYLARLVSGRPCRMGWKALLRRFWAHPGLVECSTPPDWNWCRRRLHLLRLALPHLGKAGPTPLKREQRTE